jgi:2-polyprenyl-3-methyl-5-hydroxy-6-metoxy-1,4-benzoquinol methylase
MTAIVDIHAEETIPSLSKMTKNLKDLTISTETIRCDLCESESHTPLFNKMRHNINLTTVICENCSLIYTNPQPTKECLDSFYQDYYHLFHQRKGADESYVSKSARIDARRIKALQKVINFEDNNNKVLEIACGVGEFISQLSKITKWEISGIEPGKESHAICESKKLNVEKINFENFSTEIKFDLLACFFAVDHLRSPKQFFEKCNSILKEDGLLFVEIGNFNKPFKPYSELQQLPKLFSFTPIILVNYLKSSGFEIIYYNEIRNVLSVVVRKTAIKSKNIIKTDIDSLKARIYWVDKIQTLAEKVPTWFSISRSIKNALHKISV